ncbi:MAG: alpha/beta hydrolase [Deinococcus-Thermus bacterium]|nr:alpha/beta hydrolase [Deinococcota bacterium]
MMTASFLRKALALALLVLMVPGFAQDSGDAAPGAALVGTWSGAIDPDGLDIGIRLTFTGEDGQLTGTLDIPAQGAAGLTLAAIEGGPDGTVRFTAPQLPGGASFAGTVEGATLRGTFTQSGTELPFEVERAQADAAPADRPQTPVPPFPYRQVDVAFEGPAGTLAGTLALPEGAGPHPVVILLNGSGAQDRDATVLGHPLFAVLADHLARAGLGSLRWDDRGVGGSDGDLREADLSDLVADARAAATFLAGHPDVDPERIAVLGHSEGGLVAPRLAQGEPPEVAALVLLAAPAVSGLEVLELQNRLVLGGQGASEERIAQQIAFVRALADALEAGDEAEARRLVREQVAVALDALPEGQAPTGEAREAFIEQRVTANTSPVFASFVLVEPQPVLQAVAVPTLALYARQDVQVPAVQNEGAMRAALRIAGVDDATVETLPGLNHLFQPARTGALAEYGEIETTMAPAALERVATWLNERLAR